MAASTSGACVAITILAREGICNGGSGPGPGLGLLVRGFGVWPDVLCIWGRSFFISTNTRASHHQPFALICRFHPRRFAGASPPLRHKCLAGVYAPNLVDAAMCVCVSVCVIAASNTQHQDAQGIWEDECSAGSDVRRLSTSIWSQFVGAWEVVGWSIHVALPPLLLDGKGHPSHELPDNLCRRLVCLPLQSYGPFAWREEVTRSSLQRFISSGIFAITGVRCRRFAEIALEEDNNRNERNSLVLGVPSASSLPDGVFVPESGGFISNESPAQDEDEEAEAMPNTSN